MISEQNQCDDLLSQFEFNVDARNPPDKRRRGQFKVGWNDSTIHGGTYDERSLKRLTWRNLGYRLGKIYDVRDEGDIEETYECFATHYEISGLVIK
jgi:putative restriction endonuclease